MRDRSRIDADGGTPDRSMPDPRTSMWRRVAARIPCPRDADAWCIVPGGAADRARAPRTGDEDPPPPASSRFGARARARRAHRMRLLRRFTFAGVLLTPFGATPSAHAEASFAASPSTLSLPDGPGSIMGMGDAFEVRPGTGNATWSLPFDVLPAPGGHSPSVAFQWDATGPNGPLGPGWSMGLDAICRRTDAGPPRGGPPDAGDAFDHTSLGVLVPASDAPGGWAPRIETALVRLHPHEGGDGHGWTLRAPDGSRTTYGTHPGAREGSAGATGGLDTFDTTHCWYVDERFDRWDRSILTSWERDRGRLYPTRIDYARETPHPRTVRFVWQPRSDQHADWSAGFERVWARRLEAVESWVDVSHRDGLPRRLRRLAFTYDIIGNASRVIIARLEGEDGLTLPAQTFEWRTPVDEPRPITLPTPAFTGLEDGRVRLVDLDGDARADILRVEAAGRWTWRRQQVDGSFAVEAPLDGAPPLDARADWIFADVDGDGFRDVLHRRSTGRLAWAAHRGQHAGFAPLQDLPLDLPVPLNDPALRVLDLNGDARPDFLFTTGGRLRVSTSVVLRDADTLIRSGPPAAWTAFDTPADADGQRRSGVDGLAVVDLAAPGLHLVDMNGDGRPDLVQLLGPAGGGLDGIRVHAARGSGRFAPGQHLESLPRHDRTLRIRDLVVLDVDRDGLGDLVHVGPREVRVWANVGGRSLGAVPGRAELPERSADASIHWADVNGNGSVDLIRVDPRAATPVEGLDLAPDVGAGLLVATQNSRGGEHRFVWQSITEAESDSADEGAPWRRTTPQPMSVVRDVVSDNGQGRIRHVRWSWRDPVHDRLHGRFRTFASSTETLRGDEETPTRVTDRVFFTGVGAEEGGFGTAWPRVAIPPDMDALAGELRATIRRDVDGALFDRTLRRIEVAALGDGRVRIDETGSLQSVWERSRRAPVRGAIEGEGAWPAARLRTPVPGDELRTHTLTEQVRDRWGFVTGQRAWGFVREGGEDLPGDEHFMDVTFAHAPDRWHFGIVIEERSLRADGSVHARTRSYYDGPAWEGLPWGQFTRGVATRQDAWLAEEDRWIPMVRRAYDAGGNRVGERDALGHEFSFVWDGVLGMLPVEERAHLDRGEGARHRPADAPMSLQTRATWDLDTGLMITLEDMNGEVTRMAWDGLGRMIARWLPGDRVDAPAARWRYDDGIPSSWTHEIRVDDPDGEGWRWRTSVHHADGLLAPTGVVERWENAEGAGWRASGWTEFGATGDPVRVHLAFPVGGPEAPTGPAKDVPFATTFYDAVGRPVRQVFEDGAEQRLVYRPGAVDTWDENDVDPRSPHHATPTTVESDGLGREVRVVERLAPGDEPETCMVWRTVWDERGHPVAVELPGGLVRRWAYDTMGRVVAMDDPSAGRTLQHFDDVGRAAVVENASGEVMMRWWDAAGRLVRVEVDEGSGPREVGRYHYDTPVDGVPGNGSRGRLVRRVEGPMTTWLDYDRRGHVVRTVYEVDGEAWVTGSRWGASGELRGLIYADGTEVASTYWTQGSLRGIGSVVQQVEYGVEGAVRRVTYGNGLVESRTMDVRMRPVGWRLGRLGESPIVDLEERLDAAGVTEEVIDRVHPRGRRTQSVSYVHDARYRLTGHRSPVYEDDTLLSFRYRYDVHDSMIERDVSDSSWFGSESDVFGTRDVGDVGRTRRGAGPLHPLRVGDRHLTWDESGRLVREAGETVRTYAWDGMGRLVGGTDGTGGRVEIEWNGAWEWVRHRTWGPGGDLVAERIRLDARNEIVRDAEGRRSLHKRVMLGAMPVAEVVAERGAGVPRSTLALPRHAPWDAWAPGGEAGEPPWDMAAATEAGAWREVGPRRLRIVVRLAPGHEITLSGRDLGAKVAPCLLVGVGLVCLGGLGRRERRRGPGRGSRRVRGPGRACAVDRTRGRAGYVYARVATLAVVGGLWGLTGPGCVEETSEEPTVRERLRDVAERGRVTYLHAPRLATQHLRTDAWGRVMERASVTPFGMRYAEERAEASGLTTYFAGAPRDAALPLTWHGVRHFAPALGVWTRPDPLAASRPGLAPADAHGLSYVGHLVTLLVDWTGLSGMNGRATPASSADLRINPGPGGDVRTHVRDNWTWRDHIVAIYESAMHGLAGARVNGIRDAIKDAAMSFVPALRNIETVWDVAGMVGQVFTANERLAFLDGFAHGVLSEIVASGGFTPPEYVGRDYLQNEASRSRAAAAGFEAGRQFIRDGERNLTESHVTCSRTAAHQEAVTFAKANIAYRDVDTLNRIVEVLYEYLVHAETITPGVSMDIRGTPFSVSVSVDTNQERGPVSFYRGAFRESR